MIQTVLVLGSGSAGLIAALSLKRKIPKLNVRIVRSPDIGVIGVGEGTTPNFPIYLFDYLGISRKEFYAKAEPVWKLGIRFLWGPGNEFYYSFYNNLDAQVGGVRRPPGTFYEQDFELLDPTIALMRHGKAFTRQANGAPNVHSWHGFHIENEKLVHTLEDIVSREGIEFIDGRVSGAERRPEGISTVRLDDGRTLEADFFIDASGFRSELLGQALEEPFQSYEQSLFCDRAVVGGWDRAEEPILPYTTAEAMDAGWAWRIDHENHINRGYVYSKQFISDDDAEAEFRWKNPKVTTTRVVKFRSGRYRRSWVGNVAAIGNSCGFVEPLEATALLAACVQCGVLVDALLQAGLEPTPTVRKIYNELIGSKWDAIRDFLALHYWANASLDTPFWRHCREHTDMSGIQDLLDFHSENGPAAFAHHLPVAQSMFTTFGLKGFLVMLVGNRVPHGGKHHPTAAEVEGYKRHWATLEAQAKSGLDVKQALTYIRDPRWEWNSDKERRMASV